MPVSHCKPIIQDCDDDHHNKLVDRQQKNNNDASPVFTCIHTGSAVAWSSKKMVGCGLMG